MSAAFAWAQRAAPLFLPTQVARGNVAVLMTGRSFQTWDTAGLWRDLPQALRRLHVSYGLVRDENLADLPRYGVLIAGGPARAASPEVIAAVRKFIAAGGKLILLPQAFSLDARTYAPTPEIRAEMENVATSKLADLPAYDAKKMESADWPSTLKLYRDALDKAGATTPAQVSADGGLTSTQLLTLGLLQGRDYWLAGLASFDSSDRIVTLTLSDLAAGDYDVVDVTGERPILRRDQMSGWALAGDPEYRRPRVLAASISATDLRSKGIANIEVKAGMGRMLLVRLASKAVHVDCPEYEVRNIALRKVGTEVVLGANASPLVRAAAASLVDAIKAAGGDAKLVNDADVKIQPTRFDAIVHPEGADYEHKLAEFRNAPLDAARNLIVIGSAATNRITAHLAAPGTFTYDKIFERIDDQHPGAGRGIVGVVESVNDASFDPTDQSRDALLVGGSDDAGTTKAVEEVVRILGRDRR